MTQPTALILLATGTNRDQDVSHALELAGARTEVVPLNILRQSKRHWHDYQLLILAGGFSYADALGAGKLLALDLQAYFADEVNAFILQGKPVMGICNGFQALVKSGILPGDHIAAQTATLTFNASNHFECRWVTLAPVSQTCLWTRGLTETVYCPVAHGEGNFFADGNTIKAIADRDQIALRYALDDGTQAGGAYPYNPNGSLLDIAGICNAQGNVLGLMPHPENHIMAYQHPRWTRGERGCSGLPLFINGVRYAAQ